MFMIKNSHQGVACPLTGAIYVYDHYTQTFPRKRHTIKRRFMIIVRSPEPNKLDMNIVNSQHVRKRSALICSLNPVKPFFFHFYLPFSPCNIFTAFAAIVYLYKYIVDLSPNKNIKESELEKVHCKYNPVIYKLVSCFRWK